MFARPTTRVSGWEQQFTVFVHLREPAERCWHQGRPLHDDFLRTLAALGESDAHCRLRETLELDEASYNAMKDDLLSRRLIFPARGR